MIAQRSEELSGSLLIFIRNLTFICVWVSHQSQYSFQPLQRIVL